MIFDNIKEYTYIKDTVIIDGVSMIIDTILDDSIYAVQFHKNRDYLFEEFIDGTFNKVDFDKYNFTLKEWEDAKYLIENPIYTFEKMQDFKKSELNNSCENFITSGFISAALGSNYYYQSSRDDQANLLSDVLADIDLELKCSSDNINFTFVEHTALQIKQVSDAFTLHRLDALKKVDILKTSVENASSEDDLDKIVW